MRLRTEKTEWRLLLIGATAWGSLAALLTLLFLFSPEQARAVSAGVGAELLGGREAGVPVGLAAGAWPVWVWLGSFLQDLGTAFVSFPFVLWALHRYHDSDAYVMRRLRRIETKAREHERFIERWGPLGLGLFILVPFLVNGPFVALVLGRLSGIPTRNLLAPIIAGTIVSAGLWTFFLDVMFGLAESVDPRAGYVIAAFAVLVVVVTGIIDFAREQRALRAETGGASARDVDGCEE